jgi:hypothetical protein
MVGQVTVHEVRGRFPRKEISAGEAQRLAGPYFEKPLFPENFGASEALDGHRSLDDWVTFYQGASRLVDYLRYSGQNSLALTVLADGSTIYPSRLLEPTPRHDTGAFFSTAQDPVRKDVLELVFSLFDREGLSLVPVLSFTAPLPELERQLDGSAGGPEGIELVGAEGRTWRESRPAQRGLAPYYNPMDPRVQAAIQNVVAELVERYGRHPSFAGIGIELSADGYALLPGVDWGYDDATVKRFAADTGLAVPGGDSPEERFARRRRFLGDQERRNWIRWRCERLTGLHRALRDKVVAARPDAKLYLLGTEVLRQGPGERDPYEALAQGASLQGLLAEKGIDPALYRDQANLVLMRSARTASIDRHPGGALDEDFNTSPELDGLHHSLPERAALFVHEPYPYRLVDFDQVNLWSEVYTWLVAHPVPSGRWNLERYAHALARLDAGAVFDGGWMLPLGEELTSRAWIRTFLSLPASPFQDVEPPSQPVTIRLHSQGDETYVYLVNDFPWEVHAQLELTCPPDVSLRRLGPGPEPAFTQRPEGGSRLEIGLKAFDLQAFAVERGAVDVTGVQIVPDDAGLKELQLQFDRLNTGVQVRKEQEARVVAGETFRTGFEQEPAEAGKLPAGWELVKGAREPAGESATAEIDVVQFHEGRRSLRLRADEPGAALLSPSFPRPHGRVVGVWVWMKSAENPASVRIAFEGTYQDRPYVRPYTLRIEPEWKPYLLRIFDLPSNGVDSLRVRFDLATPGTVWVDDVLVTLDPLTEDERRELTMTVASLRTAWKESRWADCQRLLSSYWARFLTAHWRPADDGNGATPPTADAETERGGMFRR